MRRDHSKPIPPRPVQAEARLPLKHLWSALDAGTRQQALQALVRIVAQQLPAPFPEKGVANEKA